MRGVLNRAHSYIRKAAALRSSPLPGPLACCEVVYEELSVLGVATLKRTAYPLRGGDTLYGPRGEVTGWRRVSGVLGHKAGRFIDDHTQHNINTPTNFALLRRITV